MIFCKQKQYINNYFFFIVQYPNVLYNRRTLKYKIGNITKRNDAVNPLYKFMVYNTYRMICHSKNKYNVTKFQITSKQSSSKITE